MCRFNHRIKFIVKSTNISKHKESTLGEVVLIQKGIIQQQAELILMQKVLVVLLVDWFLMQKEFL